MKSVIKNGLPTHNEEYITSLNENHIFVFGSNTAGRHGAGAAKIAHVYFGATYGKGEGLYGRSYALPTLGNNLEQLSNKALYDHFKKFIMYAINHPEFTFILTKVGCGLAGYKNAELMYSAFLDELLADVSVKELPKNVIYPVQFV